MLNRAYPPSFAFEFVLVIPTGTILISSHQSDDLTLYANATAQLVSMRLKSGCDAGIVVMAMRRRLIKRLKRQADTSRWMYGVA